MHAFWYVLRECCCAGKPLIRESIVSGNGPLWKQKKKWKNWVQNRSNHYLLVLGLLFVLFSICWYYEILRALRGAPRKEEKNGSHCLLFHLESGALLARSNWRAAHLHHEYEGVEGDQHHDENIERLGERHHPGLVPHPVRVLRHVPLRGLGPERKLDAVPLFVDNKIKLMIRQRQSRNVSTSQAESVPKNLVLVW